MGQYSEVVCELSVCVVCMFQHANGEYPGDPDDRDPNEPDALALIEFGYHVALGGEHRDSCTERDRDRCDCGDLGFRSSSHCDGCGSSLAGDRYLMTLFRITRHGAVNTARSMLARVRHDRSVGASSADCIRRLDYAAELTRYAMTIAA